MTALVADVAGSTAIGERLGPERSKFLFDAIVGLMREEVERFGGIVAQLTGDGVFALFGVPIAHGADAERAVRAALAIHGSLARYAADVAPAYGIEIQARIAVNTGPVVVPAGDLPVDVLYNALGDTVNVAARLQTFGDLVIGAATAQQVRDRFDLEELGPVELKGRSDPVVAFRVLGHREGPPADVGTRFVGRTHELALLGDVLERLAGGQGAIVSITGEPGIGKSRLVVEAERRLGERVRFLAGHAIAYADTIPYWPVRDLLLSWLGLGASSPEAIAHLELRSELAGTLPGEADDAYPYLAGLLGLPLDAADAQRVRDQTPDSVRHETDHWLSRIIAVLAHQRPLCVVLDDLQWSDEATLSLLDKLLPAAEHAAVAFVLIHRSDPDHPAWHIVDRARRRFRPLFLELEVQPLSDDESQELAAVHAGVDIPEALGRRLVELAGGNPYFVDEAIQDLRERGALGRDAGLIVQRGDASLPAALQEAAQARLDRLEGDARELISTASVIGRTFSFSLLERLMPRTRLMPALSELQWLQLIVGEGSGATAEYRFRHGLVQEVAYGGLLEARRRELHRRVGDALLDVYRDSPDQVLGLLARHFAEANDAERAIHYLLRAGDAARSVFASAEAIELYRRALGFMVVGESDDRARQTLFKIAQTYHLDFDFHAANRALEEAFELPAPSPIRLEPLETVTWCLPAAWDREMTPGRVYSWAAILMTGNLFAGLISLGPDLGIEPDVAERFTISDDGRTYRFTLRSDARWSDGIAVSAGDFVYAYDRMISERVATANWLDGIDAIAVDERTIEIHLREPRNDLLYVLTQPPFFPWPRHIHERDGPEWHRRSPLVGNGPFTLVSREVPFRIEASPTWWGARGNVARVTIELGTSPGDVAERWRDGALDVVGEMLARGSDPDGQSLLQRAPAMTTWYLGFNATRLPLGDVRLRRAMAQALDSRGPAAALGGHPAAAGGMLPPAMPGHSLRVAPPLDVVRARALFDEAGHSDPRALGEFVLAHLDLVANAAVDIAQQLGRIGVRTRLLGVASDPELARAIKDEADMFLWAFGADYPDPGRGFLEPFLDGDLNLYRNGALLEMLAQARSTRVQEERLSLYRAFERNWIGEHVAIVPLAYVDTKVIHRPWITGMWVNSVGMSSFAHAVVTARPDRERPLG